MKGRVERPVSNSSRDRPKPWLELTFAVLILVAIGLAAWRFGRDGYLPQPFYYRVSESLMDLYTPALWANDHLAYHRWHALYPPLSFVFLEAITTKGCYALGDWAGRDCDWPARVTLLAIFAMNVILAYLTYRVADARTAWPRAVAIGLGLPMLYALERGNLLIPCFTVFMLGYGDLIRARWPCWAALAMAINFKPYLGLVALPFLIRRQWPWVAGCATLAIAIYLLTLWAYGSGSPLDIIANETRYSVAASKSAFGDLYFATAYWPLIRFLSAPPMGVGLPDIATCRAIAVGLTIVLRVSQMAALTCLAAAALRPGATDVRRLGALIACVSITAFTTGSAGYSQIFLIFLVFFEPWRGATRKVMITATYLLCLPYDHVIVPMVHDHLRSFLGQSEVVTSFGLSLGQMLRPSLLLVVQGALVALNLSDIRKPANP